MSEVEEMEETKPQIEPKLKKLKKSESGELKVNPMFNISDIGNKIKRGEKFAKLKKEKKKVKKILSFRVVQLDIN